MIHVVTLSPRPLKTQRSLQGCSGEMDRSIVVECESREMSIYQSQASCVCAHVCVCVFMVQTAYPTCAHLLNKDVRCGQCVCVRVSALRFYVGVRVAVDVHGCQVGAAFDTHTQTATSPVFGLALDVAVGGRREVLQAEQQTASFLQTPQLFSLPLRLSGEANIETIRESTL